MAGSFKPDKRGLDRLQKELQRELDKRPVRVRIEGDRRARRAAGWAPVQQVTYTGPVFQGDVRGAQLAWADHGDITQQQMITKTVSPGYEDLAEVIAELRSKIDDLGLAEEEHEDAIAHADEVLAEIVKTEPEHGRLRRALRALAGILKPIATGAAAGVSQAVQEWTKAVVDRLVLPS
jgi:hypothetical protein